MTQSGWMAVGFAAALIATGGCDDGAASRARAAPIVDSRTLGGKLKSICTKLRATERMPVLCPSWLPSARSGWMRYDGYRLAQPDFEAGPRAYLTSLSYAGAGEGRSVPFHVLLGGRCRELPLATKRGMWPAHPRGAYLRLTTRLETPSDETLIRPAVAARVSVHGRAALVLRVRPAPAGGIHGGHYAIVWNERGAGYVLSFHHYRCDSGFRHIDRARPPRRSDTRALVYAAESMTEARRD